MSSKTNYDHHEAAYTRLIKLFLESGANVDTSDKEGKTLLHYAVEEEYITGVKEILKYSPNLNHTSNKSALGVAVLIQYKSEKFVNALVDYGITINPSEASSTNILKTAIRRGYFTIVQDLINSGADVNKPDDVGYTPLYTAVVYKHVKIAELLIKHSANVNFEFVSNTLLYRATENNDFDCFSLLVENGADLGDVNKLCHAAVRGSQSGGSLKIVEYLLKKGADVNFVNEKSFDRTMLMLAVEKKNAILTRLLLANGAEVNKKSSVWGTPLQIAVESYFDCPDITKILLEFGSNINFKTDLGETALSLCIQNRNVGCMKWLFYFGANLDSKGAYHEYDDYDASIYHEGTPLSLAVRVKNPKIVRMILEAGVNFSKAENSITMKQVNDDFYPERDLEAISNELSPYIVLWLVAEKSMSEEVINAFQFRCFPRKTISFCDKCFSELLRMKKAKLKNSVSYLEILLTRTEVLSKYLLRNKEISHLTASKEYAAKFPIYFRMLQVALKKARKHLELMDKASEILSHVSDELPKLPYECTEKIVQHLTLFDLRMFFVAFESRIGSVFQENVSQKEVASGM